RTEVRVQGRNTNVPSTRISERTVITLGSWLKTASVQDEFCIENEIVPDPEPFIAALKQSALKPDLFTFSQKVDDLTPRYNFYREWQHMAVIPITSYQDWLKKDIRKGGRVNLNRARREGVVVRLVPFDEKLVQGIKDICDESPVRQGRRFWHYGKNLDAIAAIYGTYCDRADYIGAYFEDELIGFTKIVYVGNIARTMGVLGKQKYFHKRPINA